MKRHPIAGMPFHLEQTRKRDDDRRDQRRGQFAPDAETIHATARLAGFDKEGHFHGELLPSARVPFLGGSCQANRLFRCPDLAGKALPRFQEARDGGLRALPE
jgi:hypothetical protein